MKHEIISNALLISKLVLLITMLGIALYTDLKVGKIYNKLTMPCMLAGLTLNTIQGGIPGLLHSFEGILLVLVIFLLFAKLGSIGGGDVKLLMAVGAVMGLNFATKAMLLSAVAGGVLAIIVICKRRISFAALASNFIVSATTQTPIRVSQESQNEKFRYSPAIVVGTVLTIFLRT